MKPPLLHHTIKPPLLHLWVPNLFEFKGGIQVYLSDFLTALKNFKNTDFLVLNKVDKALPGDQSYSNKISFFFAGNAPSVLRTLYFSTSIIWKALTEKPDLVICGHINFSPIAFWICSLTGVPYWILVYGVDAWLVKDYWKIRALHAADKIVSIGEYTRNRLVEEQDLPIERIVLLPVTFDASRFKIDVKPEYLLHRYGLAHDQPILLTVARLDHADRYKGYDKILQSLPEIRRQIPKVHYLLVGKGSDRLRIEQLIQQLGLQDCVTLAGFVPDAELCDHYNLCNVFAMPSKGEGFGIVYLEALACGKPTLGGNQDGAIDALRNGELGVLVDPDDISAIAQALLQMLKGTYPHPLLYQPEVLRQKVIEIYGFERFRQTLVDLLQNAGLGEDL